MVWVSALDIVFALFIPEGIIGDVSVLNVSWKYVGRGYFVLVSYLCSQLSYGLAFILKYYYDLDSI